MTFKEKFSYLDYDAAMQYVAESEDIYKIILETYVTDQRLDILNQAFAEKDWDRYRIEAHGVKSTSKTIGANELSEEAKKMEFAVKEDNIQIIIEHHEEFIKNYRDLVDRIMFDLKSL
mgnify:CR=1 FL=1